MAKDSNNTKEIMPTMDIINLLAELLGDTQRELRNSNNINILLGVLSVLIVIFCIFFELHLI